MNGMPLYLLYNALRVPALQRQVQEMKQMGAQMEPNPSGD
jgi:hypothetical protein